MRFDLKKLKSQGKFYVEFRCEYDPDPAIVDLPGAAVEGKAVVSGTLDIGEKSVRVDATAEAVLAGECSRCLAPAVFRVSAPLAEVFSEKGGQDEDGYTYSRGELDLREAADEALALAMPRRILCKEDCSGLCPGCGADLNVQPCRCKSREEKEV